MRARAACGRCRRAIKGRQFSRIPGRASQEGEHGQAFAYKTVNTEVLCWVMQRVGGSPLAELLFAPDLVANSNARRTAI